jgi:hypothetical protein
MEPCKSREFSYGICANVFQSPRTHLFYYQVTRDDHVLDESFSYDRLQICFESAIDSAIYFAERERAALASDLTPPEKRAALALQRYQNSVRSNAI